MNYERAGAARRRAAEPLRAGGRRIEIIGVVKSTAFRDHPRPFCRRRTPLPVLLLQVEHVGALGSLTVLLQRCFSDGVGLSCNTSTCQRSNDGTGVDLRTCQEACGAPQGGAPHYRCVQGQCVELPGAINLGASSTVESLLACDRLPT